MNKQSICECLTSRDAPEPYKSTHPIRPKMNFYTVHEINKHELTCEKAQLIRDEILTQQSLDGPYPCD